MTTLWGYNIQSAVLSSVFYGAQTCSLDLIVLSFFLPQEINIYLCVWFLPQRYSNICSIIIAFSDLLSTLPYPYGAPTVPGLPHIGAMCLSVYSYLLPSPYTHPWDNKWSLKSQAGVIIEVEKMCIFSYSFSFQWLLPLHVNQFK